MNSFLDRAEGSKVLHIGAYTGNEGEYYANRGWEVVWVEAQPELCERLVSKGEYCICEVISDKAGVEPFYTASNSASSSLLEFGSHTQHYPHIIHEETTIVQTITLNDLIDRYSLGDCDILNIDIEGMGPRVLMTSELGQFNYIYAEVYTEELYRGCTTIADLNVEGFEIIEQAPPFRGWCDVLLKKI